LEHTKLIFSKVPTLRFKSFEQEWEYSTIGKCSISLEYGMNAAAKTYDGKHKYIRITDINEETSAFDPNPLSSPDGEYEEKYLVKENDILFARTGASVGKSYLYDTKDGELYFAGFLIRARIKHIYNGAFVYYQTKSKKYEKWVKLTSMRSGQPGINSQEYSSYTIGMTSRTEQDKIADFLLSLDRKIAVQNKIISKYETLIKGISNILIHSFSLHSKVKLSDILLEYNERTQINNEYPILSSTMNGIFVQSDYFNKQAASEDTIGYKKVPYGYCTYRSMSDTGVFKFNLQKVVDLGIVSPAYPVFTSTVYDIDFVVFYMNNAISFKRQILEAKEGGTRFALSYSKLIDLTIPNIPKIQQKKIVDTYSTFSKKMEIEKAILSKLKEQKNYLLSKMFI
jgi:putative specificity determinant hsdS